MAENMSYDELKEATEGYTLRPCQPHCTPLRPGLFNPTTLPMDALDDNQLSRVHYIDCIMEFTEPIEILAVQSTLALNLFGDLGLGLVFAR